MSQGNSKMARPSTDYEEITNHNNLHNQNLIRFEKTKKNRIVKKYGKLLEQLSEANGNLTTLQSIVEQSTTSEQQETITWWCCFANNSHTIKAGYTRRVRGAGTGHGIQCLR